MIFARTPMRGMASDSGTDRAIGASGSPPGPGAAPGRAGPAGWAAAGSASERGGSGGA